MDYWPEPEMPVATGESLSVCAISVEETDEANRISFANLCDLG